MVPIEDRTVIHKNSTKALFWQTLPDLKSIALSWSAHASPGRPSYKRGIEVKMCGASVKWTSQGRTAVLAGQPVIFILCLHAVRIEPGPPQLETGGVPPEPWYEQFFACWAFMNTGLFEMIVGVLTTCHTQYTWDRSIYKVVQIWPGLICV